MNRPIALRPSEYRELCNRKEIGAIRKKVAQSTKTYRSRLEQKYAEHLQKLLLAEEITSWKYEAIAFKIGKRCWYHPDFLVIHPGDWKPELHEVKGPFSREDSRVKLLAAKALFPFFSWIIVKEANGMFVREIL